MERLTDKLNELNANGKLEYNDYSMLFDLASELEETRDKIENGTLVEATIVTDFVNSFIDYLLKSEAECGDTERENIEACIYQEIFQVFGRKVEKQLGIKVFEEDGENGN